MKQIKCLYQVFKPSKRYPQLEYKNNKLGDCQICKTDEKNALCSGYYPIVIIVVENKP